MCAVTLIGKETGFEPRFKFWIENKTRRGEPPLIPLGDLGDRAVKALVDTTDGHENLWKLIAFLQCLRDIALPQQQKYSVVDRANESLVTALQSSDRSAVLDAIHTALGSSLTDHDVALIAGRKQELSRFDALLNDREEFERARATLPHQDGKQASKEAVWQAFFERNPWIFGYGLKLVAFTDLDDEKDKLERVTTGASLFVGSGKRPDAVMQSRGYISSLLLCEMKTHITPLLEKAPYRKADVYRASHELVGGVAQIQKTARKAIRQVTAQVHSVQRESGEYTGVDLLMTRPRQVVLIGNLSELYDNGRPNGERCETFELYRTSILDTEIITFDELYERARFIVSDNDSQA